MPDFSFRVVKVVVQYIRQKSLLDASRFFKILPSSLEKGTENCYRYLPYSSVSIEKKKKVEMCVTRELN